MVAKIIYKSDMFLLGSNGSSISIVYHFLTCDASGRSAEKIKYWIKDPQDLYYSSNACSLEKSDDDIIIGDCLDEEISQEEYYKYAVTVSAKSLYDLLTQWIQICKDMPEVMTVYLDGKELSIEWSQK